ncbi:MAG: phosphonate C-P lyase system protein PhnG [Spirochaetales bacterium]|nr:phosphonate C-P lyase system protein PhnG [Spirochaetales bacterium]
MNISQTLSACRIEDIEAFVQRVCDREEILVMEKPSGAMVMMKHRDPLEKTPFYIGEVYVTQCTVKVSGHIGYGCVMGHDAQRALYAAICDAVEGSSTSSQDKNDLGYLRSELHEAAEAANKRLDAARQTQEAMTAGTRVDFVTRPE